MLKKYATVFFISMLPIVELRGAIPVGATLGLDFWENYLLCVLGNVLPVPFLILFAKGILEWLSRFEKIGPFFQKIIRKADEKAKNLGKFELLGLFLFVAVPAPGTSAWTGSLIAAILRLRLRSALLAIVLGVMASGIIMGILSFGLLSFLGI
ncbi:MAG: COG2426 family protein [Oscillospiraceae bacterium]